MAEPEGLKGAGGCGRNPRGLREQCGCVKGGADFGLDFAHRTVFFRLGKHRVGQLPERYFFHPPPYISKRALRAPSGIASKTRVLFAVSGGGVACPWTILFRGIPGGKNRN